MSAEWRRATGLLGAEAGPRRRRSSTLPPMVRII